MYAKERESNFQYWKHQFVYTLVNIYTWMNCDWNSDVFSAKKKKYFKETNFFTLKNIFYYIL